ncbi:hypothetical protein [Paraburkholderia youngii]|uniref:hypothetical protein n=1 Tax=Paraburkholderia youngii TaxID=2782701 RepID=UPI003D1E6588
MLQAGLPEIAPVVAVLLLPRFVQIGRRRHQHNAGVAQRFDFFRGWQPEMKADGNGTFFQQHRQHRVVVDEAFVSNARGYRGLRLEAREMRLQIREPPSVAHRIHDRANVAEDVHAKRPVAKVAQPAIGAWMIGTAIPSFGSSSALFPVMLIARSFTRSPDHD